MTLINPSFEREVKAVHWHTFDRLPPHFKRKSPEAVARRRRNEQIVALNSYLRQLEGLASCVDRLAQEISSTAMVGEPAQYSAMMLRYSDTLRIRVKDEAKMVRLFANRIKKFMTNRKNDE